MTALHRFFLVFRGHSGFVHEEELDFNALVHDVAFSAVCAGRLSNDGRWGPVDVEPEWADGRVAGVKVSVAGTSVSYARTVFADRAMEILRAREQLGAMQAGGEAYVTWTLEVRAKESGAEPARRRVSVRHRAYPFVQRPPGELTPGAAAADDVVSVSVAAGLAAELRKESAGSLERERADFLVGRLVHEEDGRVAVVALDRIPATTGTEGSLVHFLFTPLTFQAAQRELDRRGSGHVILGWHHNHPPPCGRECLMTIPACATDNVLFSVDDRVVHRSAFSLPYMVALVSGKGPGRRADDPLMRAFGWRRGLICEKDWSTC